ncbi:MAG TPA: TetR/AcrR family transcriptional regulator [Solirubrobacteraceae bacterium]|jgi:AcrR family transcriptional regulator|nr:TetR/AcrR family transcriptional regulator [Solirubrobacteraceae bacterium]
MRRQRILEAMALVVCERGYARASVVAVSRRAKVSRRTFYEHFGGLQECFLAMLEDGMQQALRLMSGAFEQERSWTAGIRRALAALLDFLDRRPALAHVLLVEAVAAGEWSRQKREQYIDAMLGLIETNWMAPEDERVHALVNVGIMTSLLGVLQSHCVQGRSEPFVALLGPMMGIVTMPYLERALVRREVERGSSLAMALLEQDERAHGGQERASERVHIPEMLLNTRARRARESILFVAVHPGASNREIADAIGIRGHAQTSTLLARLERMGLVCKLAREPGAANAWRLTTHGISIARALGIDGAEV